MSRYPRDVISFLNHYVDEDDAWVDPRLKANLLFYSNKLKCRPDGLLIDDLHREWYGDYQTLEYKHGYIQWLFPIQEYGMNYDAQPLQPHEIALMKGDPTIMERVLTSYRLMLDFYGMKLESPETGHISRSPTYARRYSNLVRSSHNNLRITRILKCLSELGLEHLNAGFLLFVLSEQSEHDQLNTRGIQQSMDGWWARILRNNEERESMEHLVRAVRSGQLHFTTADYENLLEQQLRRSRLDRDADPVASEGSPSHEGTAERSLTTDEKAGETVDTGRQDDESIPEEPSDDEKTSEEETAAVAEPKAELSVPSDHAGAESATSGS